MANKDTQSKHYVKDLQLFIEELCCTLYRFRHIKEGLDPDEVKITRKYDLGSQGLFAGVMVKAPNQSPYFIEVQYGRSPERICSLITEKYGQKRRNMDDALKVILFLDNFSYDSSKDIQKKIKKEIQSDLELEVYGEQGLLSMVRDTFHFEIDAITPENAHELKEALDTARGRYAFGKEWTGDTLQVSLLWHFSPWRLRELGKKWDLKPRSMIPPGDYGRGVVLLADLCSFSSYVRDTREDDVVAHALSSFYTMAAYEIMNAGGMMYQFIGDEIVGFYGIPDGRKGYLEAALNSAKAILDIGNSVSKEWQDSIDRVQASKGVHVGMACGGIQIVNLRPFGRAHLTAVSDAMNMASRLCAFAAPGEIVVSNSYYKVLDSHLQAQFEGLEPVDARNMGKIKAWKLSP
jgi:class 3 adenylate cyclase